MGGGEVVPTRKLDLMGHVAYALVFGGVFLLAKEMQMGWALRFLGELGWIFIGLKLRMTSIWAWGVGFAILDAMGYFMWEG
jgi:hypothetical protein